MSHSPRRVAAFVAPAFAALVASAAPACRDPSGPGRPLETCAKACEDRASRSCSAAACARGCELALDRLVEHEGANVIACVAARNQGCGDRVWAECAVAIGPHADGGPPAPPPPADDD